MVQLNQSSKDALNRRALIHLSFGNYQRAFGDLDALIQSGDAIYYQHYQAALLALAVDDPASYPAACQHMLETFSNSDKTAALDFTAWTCALSDNSLTDYTAIIALAKQAIEKIPESAHAHRVLGGLLLRAGDHESAIDELQQASELTEADDTSSAYVDYLLAIAHHRLGDSASAQTSLAQANAVVDSLQQSAERTTWNRKLTFRLLQEEATALIEEGNAGAAENGDTQK